MLFRAFADTTAKLVSTAAWGTSASLFGAYKAKESKKAKEKQAEVKVVAGPGKSRDSENHGILWLPSGKNPLGWLNHPRVKWSSSTN